MSNVYIYKLLYISFIRVKREMGNIYIFLSEGNFLSLSGYVYLDRHLPLIRPH